MKQGVVDKEITLIAQEMGPTGAVVDLCLEYDRRASAKSGKREERERKAREREKREKREKQKRSEERRGERVL